MPHHKRNRPKRRRVLALLGVVIFNLPLIATAEKNFVHPGMLHSRTDLDRMKKMVAAGTEPWKSGWEKLRSVDVCQLDYEPHPVEHLSVASGGAAGGPQQYDAGAAHFHAIQWAITGDPNHAKKAAEILNAWSGTLKSLEGHNAKLQAGITGFKFCNAAEILRYTEGSGWSDTDHERFKKMLMEIYYPTIQDFQSNYNGNWDAYMVLTMMCIGVYCDDHAIFDRAVDHFYHGPENGSITGYIYPTGQCQESTRDQFHVQMGLGALAGACEVAYHQGLDLYGADDNRLLAGYEYSAKYNLGHDVPCEGEISPRQRGRFRPVWEIACNHYVHRRGLDAPWLTQVVEKIRPEAFDHDFICFGTLFFAQSP